jgi:hypothetical protein
MELKQYVKMIMTLALALSPALVFGYDNDKTHPMLTGEAIKLFEASGQLNFNEGEKTQIVQGSKDEDNIPRWLEHFYDPINNRGLNGGQFAISKKWAHGQNSTGNDYSWENAIYGYAYGDKEKGLYALGHVMHLVQDSTVPDHARDDAHVFVKNYEAYAYEQNSVPSVMAIYLDSINSYFDSAANFSNNNFFSDDTILKYYVTPKVLSEKWEKTSLGTEVDFGMGNNGRIVLIKKFRNNLGILTTEYSLKDTDNKVMSDYWNTLAPKAVGYSAGVIKLFLSEVEKEKATGALKKERMPWWEKLLELLQIRIDELLASVNLSIKEAEENPPPLTPVSVVPGVPAPEPKKANQEELIETRNKLQELKTDLAEVTDKGEIAVLPVIRSVNTVISSLGGKPVHIEPPATTTATTSGVTVTPPVIVFPADFSQSFATTSITFSGTASSSLIIFNDFDRGQATTSETGEWLMVINNFPQGSSTIKFFARDSEENVSLPTEVILNIDALPLSINLTISNCVQSLAPDFCLLKPTSTLNFAWELTKPGDYKYDLIKTENDYGDWLSPEIVESGVSAFEISASLDLGARDLLREFKWQILARDASSSEVVASSSEISTIFHPRPIVINEIGWAGTIASNLDEWLELRNYLWNYAINLDDYYLTDTNQTWVINLSGDIRPESYYLIERDSDDVISNRLAKLLVDFVSDSNSKSFNPDNLGLKLWHKTISGDELVDETPVWNETGSASSSLERTFERYVSTDLSTWRTNEGCNAPDGPCALDRNATTTFGTPGVINRASIPRLW